MKTASLHLDTHYHVGAIDPRLFSGFLEHLGRAVYEGVYDPGNPRSDPRGFRLDVIDALKPMRMPLVRYPGGNFVSNYDWRDGVGPKPSRPVRPDYAWKSIEPNTFGTDEFMAWCKAADTAPMLAVNLGTLGAREAQDLLEYCNVASGTYWSDRRIANGHRQPYGVKVWCLGNEMDGPWQAGHVPAEVYAQRASQAALLMKGLDPTIELVACGSSGRGMATYMQWDRVVLEQCWDKIDFLSAHRYSNPNWGGGHGSDWLLGEGVEIDRIIQDYAGLLAMVRGQRRSDKQVYLSFDEWNVWYKNMEMDGKWKPAPHLLEEVYDLQDALVNAQYLNAFIRHADVVKIACIAQIVNVIAPILTRPEGVLIQSIFWPFVSFAREARGVSLRVLADGPTCKAGVRGEVPMLDASASFDAATGQACVFAVNRSVTSALPLTIRLADRRIRQASVELLTGPDAKAANTWEKPDLIRPRTTTAAVKADGTVQVRLPKTSFAVVKLATGTR